MNYPKGTKREKSNVFVNHGKRGMCLETFLNQANEYYLEMKIANIHKKPTPIQVVKAKKPKIIEAYFTTPSTTDYNGIYKGKYIDFEAKETKLNYFPLANIHQHQIKHLLDVRNHGGISFLIIYFTKIDKIFVLESKYLEKVNTKIPLSFLEENGHKIEYSLNPVIDYIKIIDKIMEDKNE